MFRLLALVLLLLGCPRTEEETASSPIPDPPVPAAEPASFSNATSGELGIMVLAGYGGDVFLASNAYSAAHADAESDGCPSAALTADGYELSAEGCEASASGRAWSGRLVAHNPTAMPELPGLEGSDFVYDAAAPVVMEFVGLSASLEGQRLAWDGSLEITPLRGGTLVDSAMTTTASAGRSITALTTFACGLPDDPSWCGPIGTENLIFLGDDLEIAPSTDPESYALCRFEANDDVLTVDVTTMDFDTGCVVGTLQTGESLNACMPDGEIVDVEPVVNHESDDNDSP